MSSLYKVFSKLAFHFDAEWVHIQSLKWASRYPFLAASLFSKTISDSPFNIQMGNLTWPFPVGLAAGLDKNGEALDFFGRLPFGGIEVGTVTPCPQEGNPPPRLFRLTKEYSLLNRMGFNNVGAEQVLDNLRRSPRHGKVLGVNMGKNRGTPEDKTPDDYRLLYRMFEPVADYLVINVSSPNTPGLRRWQKAEKLRAVLNGLEDLRTSRPLFLKISPDLSPEDMNRSIELAKEYNLDGIVSVNTTVIPERGEGGISGGLLKEKAREVRDRLLARLRETPHMHIIGVGGIDSLDELIHFWKNGGRITQIYTSFIYQGPQVLEDIYSGLARILNQTGAENLNRLLEDNNYGLKTL